MAGWEVSRHPEWDLMYTAGLTVREISHLVHRSYATVHAHVRTREKYQPGYQKIHESALALRDMDKPSDKWMARLEAARNFFETHARLPLNSADQLERSLYYWVTAQRRSMDRGTLSPVKISLLDILPNWRISNRQLEIELKWYKNLNDLVAFVAANKDIPRYKTYKDENERRLGVWLHNQHQKRMEKSLNPQHEKELDEALPGWRSHS